MGVVHGRVPPTHFGLRRVSFTRRRCPEGASIDPVAVGIEDGEHGVQTRLRNLAAHDFTAGHSRLRARVVGQQLGLAVLADLTPKFPVVSLSVEPDFVSASKHGPPRSSEGIHHGGSLVNAQRRGSRAYPRVPEQVELPSPGLGACRGNIRPEAKGALAAPRKILRLPRDL